MGWKKLQVTRTELPAFARCVNCRWHLGPEWIGDYIPSGVMVGYQAGQHAQDTGHEVHVLRTVAYKPKLVP
jgi:hypothetical protein